MMRTRPAAQGHADPVANAVRRSGAGLPVDEVVRASWNRCINTYSLDPQETRRPTMVERADLQARRGGWVWCWPSHASRWKDWES